MTQRSALAAGIPLPYGLDPASFPVQGPPFPVTVRENAVVSSLSGSTPVQMLRADPNRWAWLLLNLSNQDLYIGWGNNLLSVTGIYLPPFNGYVYASFPEDGEVVWREVWGNCTGSSGSVYTLEWVKAA